MAVDPLLERFIHERDQKKQLIENYKTQAAEEGRDLTETEMQAIESSGERVRALNTQIDLISRDLEMATDTQDRLRALSPGFVGNDHHYRSAGDLLWDVLHQSDPEAKTRYQRVMRRAAEHMGTTAAATTPTAGDLGGLIVKPVVGPVSDPFPRGMPLATALGVRDIPASDGFGFSRPYIVDANFETGVAAQTLEKAELASKAFSVAVTNVPLSTVGGYLNVSAQLTAFQPSSLQIIIDQLRRRLENAIDKAILAEMDNSTGVEDLAAAGDASAVIKAVYNAAAKYYNVTKELPSVLVLGPLGWARLGGLTDAAGRPLFPTLGAANAPGTANAGSFSMTVAGLTPVVTPSITNTDMWVTGSAGIEAYLYRYPVLEAVEPSVLGRQVALAASVAGFRPTPFANASIRIYDAP